MGLLLWAEIVVCLYIQPDAHQRMNNREKETAIVLQKGRLNKLARSREIVSAIIIV